MGDWEERDLAPLSAEWSLFRQSFCSRDWQTRLDAWKQHFDVYAKIEEQNGAGGAKVIDSLFDHLSILDTKFGFLLGFITLLLIGSNFLVTHAAELLLPWQTHHSKLEPWIFRVFAALFIAYGTLGMFVIYLCLSGVRRIVWGDLGRSVSSESASKDAIITACQQHEKDLIVELVRRTNRLRVAILFTGYEFWLLCLILAIGATTVIGARFL